MESFFIYSLFFLGWASDLLYPLRNFPNSNQYVSPIPLHPDFFSKLETTSVIQMEVAVLGMVSGSPPLLAQKQSNRATDKSAMRRI